MTERQSKGTAPKPIPRVASYAEPYWAMAREDKLGLPFCPRCVAWIFYPRHWCPHCYGSELEWRETGGRGSVYSFSVVHQAPFEAYEAEVPYVLAIIELAEGPHLMANVVDCAPETVHVGMPVRVVFETRAEGFKLPQFTPETSD